MEGTPTVSEGLRAARSALAGGGAWLVGGAVRDRALGRQATDFDVVVDGDPEQAARSVARAAGRAACFELSRDFGAWRVVARDSSWQLDVEPLRGGDLAADLALRDFTVNAIAEPLDGGAPIDPLGGLSDLAAGRLRMVAEGAFASDPLRVLRLVRTVVELGLEPDADTLAAAARHARSLGAVSPERVFAELNRVLASDDASGGFELMTRLGAAAAVLPELEALRGVEQNRFHHRDVHGHTLEVLDRTSDITREGGAAGGDGPGGDVASAALGPNSAHAAAVMREPLADGLTRGQALRWGALLHDAAKPLTHEVRSADGRVTFIGHDVAGAQLAREVLGRLRSSERLAAHVAALVRHHLRLGFLVHEPQPLAPRTVYRYLRTCEPVEVDVTVLSVADRLATRGDNSERAIAAHLALAAQVLEAALAWHRGPRPAPLVRGDELADALGIAPGPQLGTLLESIAEARYAGELAGREDAIEYARSQIRTS
ncbi:MAG TPA: HD domain-containing protein [Solirubrobacteraceae bacterium]|nr:HD domain-containing protein [Solirubrobacteraceae bacterium]